MVFGSFHPPSVPCGMSSAVRNLLGSGLTDHYDLEVVSTYRADEDRGHVKRLIYGTYLGLMSALRVAVRGADIVDVHAVSDRDFLKQSAVLLGTKLVGRPAVMRIHGGDFDRVFERSAPFVQEVTRRVLRRADRVVVLSERWRRVISAIEPRARIAEIPNAVDSSYFARLMERRSATANSVLMLANLCERKGHFDALEAAAIVLRTHPEVEFLFGGGERDPGARQELEKRALELGIANRISFLGPVIGGAKDDLFARAGLLILPSHQENAPLSVIEGMAAGLPVVATSVGGIPEIIEHGVTGLLVEPRAPESLAAAINQLLDRPEQRRTFGAAGFEAVRRRWDRAAVADLTAGLYAELGVL